MNRKDPDGRNVFQGGFLGLDNIGVFDRSRPLGDGNFIEQSDGTSWMAAYCLHMLAMAMELAHEDPAYEDVASKFFEHFVYISQAMNDFGGEGFGLWNEEDGFYYDMLHLRDGRHIPMKVRSMVGIVPLFAAETFEPEDLAQPALVFATDALVSRPPSRTWAEHVDMSQHTPRGPRLLLTIANPPEARAESTVTSSMKTNYLSPHGVRALSKYSQGSSLHARFRRALVVGRL